MTRSDPLIRSRKTRVAVALQKFYLEGWSKSRIAEYLEVTPQTVSSYFNDPMAEGVEEVLAEEAAAVRLEIARELLSRFEELRELEETHMETKRTIVTGYELRDVDGRVASPEDLVDGEGPEATLPRPVAVQHKEVVAITDDLQALWREQHRVLDALTDLLGLSAPDRIEATSTPQEVLRIEPSEEEP